VVWWQVRVSRQRILESAAKVFELYSGHKSVLEVEYFGEVGTGLGPTLEFYTLLSHELQKKHLHLWRAELAQPAADKGKEDVLETEADLMDLDDEAAPGEHPAEASTHH
jgi:E3 ubiquitin-protein ligase TRIP12